jgi:hypothetical protein
MAEKNNTPVDERSAMQKIAAGHLGALDCEDITGSVSMAAGLAGPVAGKVLPGVDAVQAVFSGIQGEAGAAKEYRRIAQRFGDPKMLARSSRAVKRKLRELEDRWKGNFLESAASAGGGALVGATLGSVIAWPIPLLGVPMGFVAGSIAGGMGGSYLYNKACVEQAQDPLTINEQICKIRDAGEPAPPELVFAALAANLSGADGKRADRLLKRHTGTKFFTEALGREENMGKLSAMMNDRRLDTAIRAQLHMPVDPAAPFASVAEQYAQAINQGRLDPTKLLVPGAGLQAIALAAAPAAALAPQVPVTPGKAGQARGLA